MMNTSSDPYRECIKLNVQYCECVNPQKHKNTFITSFPDVKGRHIVPQMLQWYEAGED